MKQYFTHFHTPFIQLENYELNPEIVNLIPFHLAEQHQMIAIDKIGDILTLGITHEHEKYILPFLEEQLGYKIIPVLVSLEAWLEIFPTAYIDNQPKLNYIG